MRYLPYVKGSVGPALAQGIRSCDEEQYLDRELATLDKTNPAISTWLRNYSETTDDPRAAIFSGLMVYKLLYSQAESDAMSRTLRLG